MYITVKELRDEGAEGTYSRLQQAILLSQAYIEKMTGQFFEIRNETYNCDGSRQTMIHLPVFCMAITYVKENGLMIAMEDITLYNRFYPDDRLNPKIVFARPLLKGKLNIEIHGSFGFVEEDGSTPLLIKQVCKKLALTEVNPLSDIERKDLINQGRIASETTDGHSYSLQTLAYTGEYTGDPEIDSILLRYKRPLTIGGV